MAELLELKNISKIYANGIYANRNVDFSVSKGEIHALVGENGAGKSTLMKVIYGLEQPDMGEIYLDGKKVAFGSAQDAMAHGIGMVHQHFMLVESLSITENVTLGFEPSKLGFINKAEARKKVIEIMKTFDLNEDPDKCVRDLPVGVKQKVEIIKALYRGARILILDEPTAVLTPQETAELFAKLKRLKETGFTVIFISHKLREVMKLCDRCSVMRRGELIDTVLIGDVTQQDISALMMGHNYSDALDKNPLHTGEVRLKITQAMYVDKFGKNAVDGVSLSVRSGEILGVAGVEGNGQNELVQMAFALAPMDGGRIEIMGRDIAGCSIAELRDMGVCYIPADRMTLGLAKTMSIADNLISVKLSDKRLYKRGLLSKKQVQNLSGQLVEQYQVKCSSPMTLVEMLSGGNMQKVVAAREFTQEPKVFIVEQPSRGIDVGAAKFLHEKLLAMRDAGCAILLITADLDELYKLSDSAVVMYEGRISAYFETLDGVSESELGNYMLGIKRQTPDQIGRACHD